MSEYIFRKGSQSFTVRTRPFILAGIIISLLGCGYILTNMETVPAGYVGIKVNLYCDKGVNNQVVTTGRYFLTLNQKMYTFPTFNQLHSYDQDFVFQTSDAMDVRAKVGIEYNIDSTKVSKIFQTYRKGIEQITEINLRQLISDALIKHASNLDINQLTAGGKTKLLDNVTNDIRNKLQTTGINVIKLSWVSDLQYPQQVKQSINAKIEATQRALLRENEIAQSRAEAQKEIEEARGIAQSTRIRAQAEADAINIKAKALRDNPDIIQLNAIEKWNGVLPMYMTNGAPTPFIPIK